MLISKTVMISWHPLNIPLYESKGYKYTKTGEKFEVKIEDLAPKSNAKVDIKCEYCGKIYSTSYNHYSDSKSNSIIPKDSCSKCKTLKTREANILLYGYPSPMQRKEIANKVSKKRRLNYELIADSFKERGYILLTKEYINNRQQLEYVCPKHEDKGVLTINWNHFQQGEGCKYCGNEQSGIKQSMNYDDIKKAFIQRGYILISNEYKAKEKLKYICPKHESKGVLFISWGHFQQGEGCVHCQYENILGENNPNWKGGVTETINYFRQYLKDWYNNSMKACGYKCVISGDKFKEIHHIYGYNEIVKEAFEKLKIPIFEKIINYSREEIESLKNLIIELHDKYGYGACLTKEIHFLFHKIYGRGNNTPEQFYEFKNNYLLGKYK